jgi:hypothetical protein
MPGFGNGILIWATSTAFRQSVFLTLRKVPLTHPPPDTPGPSLAAPSAHLAAVQPPARHEPSVTRLRGHWPSSGGPAPGGGSTGKDRNRTCSGTSSNGMTQVYLNELQQWCVQVRKAWKAWKAIPTHMRMHPCCPHLRSQLPELRLPCRQVGWGVCDRE